MLQPPEAVLEVMMNGVSYYRFNKGSDEWNKRVAESKFSKFSPIIGITSKPVVNSISV